MRQTLPAYVFLAREHQHLETLRHLWRGDAQVGIWSAEVGIVVGGQAASFQMNPRAEAVWLPLLCFVPV